MIPIFLTIDNNFAKFASTAIASLIDHTNKENNYIINVIHEDLTSENEKKLKSLETDNCKIKCIKMDDVLNELDDSYSHRLRADVFTLSIYFRIFIPRMFPEYDKGIYIDSDVILNDDIANLYNIELDGNLIGAIKDESVSDVDVLANYIEGAVGIDRYSYINSGVLLLNMKKLREVNFAEHFLYLLKKYNFDTIAPDQDYINAMCKGNIKYIDYKWDTMPIAGTSEKESPSLIHYNLFYKPWHYKDAQYARYYWKYADESLFKDEIYKELESFTDEDKEKDNNCFNLMAERAIKITNDEITFKKIFESQKEKRIL